MTDKEALAQELAIGVNVIRDLEAEVRKQSDMIDVIEANRQNHLERRIDSEKERDELKAELSQCLTAHAELNDKVCALEQAIQNTLDTGMDRYIRETIEGTKLDDFNDRCIAEKWNEIND